MEMYSFNIKSIDLSSFGYFSQAFGGLYGGVRAWLKNTGRVQARPEAGRQAENARQNYNAQAMAASWHAPRYFR